MKNSEQLGLRGAQNHQNPSFHKHRPLLNSMAGPQEAQSIQSQLVTVLSMIRYGVIFLIRYGVIFL